ncbi:MAG TPA: 30S ribosomal protein S2 [Candidatus Saccharimonadales bacterium]|nr:30S ribosomal protein S2 [Candidatus Saccharimonadales bacterium]
MSKIPSMQDLLEAGVHFGHQVRRWNPKMRQYIFGEREGVHVIDLEQTFNKLQEAVDFVTKVGESGGVIIFLASKKQAKSIIVEEAQRSGAKYVVERWIGGLLTNWDLTSKNIKKLADLKSKKEAGEFKERTKKENLLIDRDIAKLERLYGGVWDLVKLPEALFVVDVRKEENACREAKKKGIPVVAICDTNANLDLVDYAIPGNDDALKAIKIITAAIADAYMEGKAAYGKRVVKENAEKEKVAAKEAAAKAKLEAQVKKTQEPSRDVPMNLK